MSVWQLQPIFDRHWVVLAMALLLGGLMWSIRPPVAGIDAYRLRWLTGLRSLVIALLLVLAWRPVYVHTRFKTPEQSIVFLVDQSRSMSIADGANGQSRWSELRETLARSRDVLAQFPKQTQFRTILFDARPQSPVQDVPQLPQAPDGPQSDVGGALQGVLQHLPSESIRAVILMSDGAQRAPQPAAEPDQMARELSRRSTALVSVPFGRGRDVAQARDISVESLPESTSVYVKNQLALAATIKVTGYVGQAVPIRWYLQASPNLRGAGRSPEAALERKELVTLSRTARTDGELLQVPVELIPTEPGEYRLTVEVEPQPGELNQRNNALTCFVRVLDGGLRVLFIESNPLSPEFQWLQRAWRSSPEIQLDPPLILPRKLREQWPLPVPPEILATRYDVYVLGDVEAAALDPAWMTQIRTHVEQGSGFLALGGFHTMGPGGYAGTPWADMLPIQMEGIERQDFAPQAPIRDDIQLKGPLNFLPANDYKDHPVFRMPATAQTSAEPTTDEIWQQLPPLLGALRWGGVREGAVRLANSQHGDPLLVAAQHGEGHVLAFAGFSTWRWQTHGFAEQHRRFWRQALLWLASREEKVDGQFQLNLSRRRIALGESIVVQVTWREAMPANPLIPQVKHWVNQQAQPVELVPSQTAEGEKIWTATLTPQSAGFHEVVCRTPQEETASDVAATLQVLDRDLEFDDPAANPSFLDRLSQATQTHGGQLLPPEELPDFLLNLAKEPTEVETDVIERWQLGDRASDVWLVFGLVIVCLSGEWFLRKKWGLV